MNTLVSTPKKNYVFRISLIHMLCPSFLLGSVCETTYVEHEVEEDVPTCKVVKEEHCEEEEKGAKERRCYHVPKQVCTQVRKVNKKASNH